MSKRITIKDVRPALANYAEACKAAGLIPEGMQIILSEGSQTYGRAWRVNLTGIMVRDADGHPTFPKGSGHYNPPCGDDYLGWTAAEALAALRDRTTGLWAGLKGKPLGLTRGVLAVLPLVEQFARITDPYEASNDDNADTLRSFVSAARDALGLGPLPDSDEDEGEDIEDAPDAGDLARDRMADAMQYRR